MMLIQHVYEPLYSLMLLYPPTPVDRVQVLNVQNIPTT